jgi:hypothetical protein
MKVLICLSTLLLLPTYSFANDLDEQINKACLRHAVSLVSKLKTDVVGDLSQDKSEQALKLATESCQAYFKKEFSQNPEPVATAQNTKKAEEGAEEESKMDWFTDKILNSDTSRKEGNKRLQKKK